VNNVFGRVLNPRNLTLSAGGSSGGEGALIAMKGSVLGVGTDIAGSVRIPSLCNGLLGFKPSANRVPYGGQVCPGTTAEFGINSVAGPLARSARDLKLFLETVTKVDPWKLDYTALNIPWRPVAKKEALRVGVIVECPSWKVSPPAVRTINSAVSKLAQAGHSTIMLRDFPSFEEARELAWGIFDLDNETTNFKYIAESGEPWVQPIIDLWSPPPGGRPRRTLEKLFELEAKQSSVKAQWHKIFVENELDVIVAPGVQHGTAVPHDKYGYPPYTAMWNVVNVSDRKSIEDYLTAS
jgi:amidase